ncbi:Bud site selection protein 6 [Lobosporangium transversale]|nr:Bud site selection protein 6 [Lobosporangium transversale]
MSQQGDARTLETELLTSEGKTHLVLWALAEEYIDQAHSLCFIATTQPCSQPEWQRRHRDLIFSALKCLVACVTLESHAMTQLDKAKTGLRLAQLIFEETESFSRAEEEVNKAIVIADAIQGSAALDVQLRLYELQVHIYIELKKFRVAKNTLRIASVEAAKHGLHWWSYHFYLLKARVQFMVNDLAGSLQALNQGATLAENRGDFELKLAFWIVAGQHSIMLSNWDQATAYLQKLTPYMGLDEALDTPSTTGADVPKSKNLSSLPVTKPAVPSNSKTHKSNGTRPSSEQKKLCQSRQLRVFFLILYTYCMLRSGGTAKALAALSALHSLLDEVQPKDALELRGVFQIPLNNASQDRSDTHNRSLANSSQNLLSISIKWMTFSQVYCLTYLLSGVCSKADMTQPMKAQQFLVEGIKVVDQEFCVNNYATSTISVRRNQQWYSLLMMSMLMHLSDVFLLKFDLASAEETILKAVYWSKMCGLWETSKWRLALSIAMIMQLGGRLKEALDWYGICLKHSEGMHKDPEGYEAKTLAIVNCALIYCGDRYLDLEKAKELQLEARARHSTNASSNLLCAFHILDSWIAEGLIPARQHLQEALKLSSALLNTQMRSLTLLLLGNVYLQTHDEQAEKMLMAGYIHAVKTSNQIIAAAAGSSLKDLYLATSQGIKASQQTQQNMAVLETVEQAFQSCPMGPLLSEYICSYPSHIHMDAKDPSHQHRSSGTQPVRRRKTDQGATNPLEATVTKLLVATKQLLEGLTLWSTKKMTEEQVSDIFVQLATQFNLASQAFHEVDIDTSELAHIPDDLRNCLETALGEPPSPASLEKYLPRIKAVIIDLLQGLRLKQNLYREQHEARTIRLQAAANASGRSKSTSGNYRQPTGGRSPEVGGTSMRVQPASPGIGAGAGATGTGRGTGAGTGTGTGTGAGTGAPTLSISSVSDEQGHAETLASLRKSDAITRRASSRRHSQRFSTVMEQNAPPVPRRNFMNDPELLSAYPGYSSSQGSTPATSPSMAPPYSQFQTTSTYERPNSPAMPSPSINRSVNRMPLPSTIPAPSSYFQKDIPSSSSSPRLGSSSMMLGTLTPERAQSPRPSLSRSGSMDTMRNAETPKSSSLLETSNALSLPLNDAASEPIDDSLTLFLQVGKSVKKTKFEGELTHSALRMLFMEKFQYNPGQEDFPTIYVKDPNTNIHYELESLADNIQRKMDQGFAALSKELHEIKKAHEASEAARQKAVAAAAAAAASAVAAPSERLISSQSENSQILRSVVHKALAKNKGTGATSSGSATSQSKVSAAELKSQYEEIQSLRRDLGVVRQLYTELQSETKSTLGNLAGYTAQIRKQTQEQPVSSRMFIETGKIKLDKKSEDLTNKIEDLQDIVEDMKVNVTQRRGRPSDSSIAFVDKQCDQIGREIEELSDFIQTVRPSWKKTWEVELQTIVKEQMFLKEQEALLEDLKEDRSSLLQTLNNLKKVLELQLKSGGASREFVFQPVVDENFEGLKTVLEEVKMIEPDSERRLKAMAQMEKLRHIELSNRIDEFEEELTSFVGASKLRKTGGALEVERQRQQRDLENLRAMFAKKDQEAPLISVETPEQPSVANP